MEEYISIRDGFFADFVYVELRKANVSPEVSDELVKIAFATAKQEWDRAQAKKIADAVAEMRIPESR